MAAFKRNAITFAITFCISFLVFGIAAYCIVNALFPATEGSENDNVQFESLSSGNSSSGFNEAIGADAEAGSSFSMLLIGTDYQPNVTPNAPSRADAIVLVKYSCEKETVMFVNIPAVTKTTVDGVEMTIAEAYTKKGDKGVSYLMEKVQGMTGLQINYYAKASIGIFDDIINSLNSNGIEYNIPVDMNYEDKEQGLVIDFKKGIRKLTGADIVKMLRYRSDSYSDRLMRNVQFARYLFDIYTDMSYKETANSLFNTVFPNLESNFNESDFLKHLDTIYNYKSYESKILTYPGDYKNQGDEIYFVADTDEAFELFAEYKNTEYKK